MVVVVSGACGGSTGGATDAGPEDRSVEAAREADVGPLDAGESETDGEGSAADAGVAEGVDGTDGAGAEAGDGGDAAEVWVDHVVQEGETLWDISVAYGVSVDDILRANHLRADRVRKLSKGRVLRIPGASQAAQVLTTAQRAEAQALARAQLPPLADGAYHFVGPGESLWEIAQLYGKSLGELATRNGFTDDDIRELSVGQPVVIPGITVEEVRTTEPAARTGIRHVMVSGETIWDLAGAFQVGVGQIMAANGFTQDAARALREGTEVWIPGVREDRGGRVRRPTSGAERGTTGLARRLGLGTREAASLLLAGRAKDSWIEAAGGDALPGTLHWPVSNGWYVRGYGSGEEGYHLATDIMGEMGWNVRAAAPGIVGYAGNEVRGYGNMVILIHPGGWITMYAHNSVNFVVAGQRVPAGGIIAEMGSTGISRGPHVHFEFMADGKNCDPERLWRPGVRHRNGHIEELGYTTWTDPDERPASVHCAPRRHHPHSRWVIDENPEEGADEPAAPAPSEPATSTPAPDAPSP